MRKLFAGALVVGLSAAAVTGLGSAPALADGTFTVSNGGTLTAAIAPGTRMILRNVSLNQMAVCTEAEMAGTADNGTGLSGGGIATITSATFGDGTTTCNGPFESMPTLVLRPGSTWAFNAVSYDSGTGTTSGTITGFDADFTESSVTGVCHAELAGSLEDVTYDNATGQLTMNDDGTPHLTFSNLNSPSACLGFVMPVREGDQAAIAGTFVVSPHLQITSP